MFVCCVYESVGQVEIGTDHPFNPCVYAVEDADEFFTNAPVSATLIDWHMDSVLLVFRIFEI